MGGRAGWARLPENPGKDPTNPSHCRQRGGTPKGICVQVFRIATKEKIMATAASSPSPFDSWQPADLRQLIASCPLAWVVPARAPMLASMLPLIGVFREEDILTELIGHFALSNPLSDALAADPHATVLFSGPSGYLSPEHAGSRQWGPTWNYAQARISVEIEMRPELTEEALDLLIDAMERGREVPWKAAELGARGTGMMRRIIGFRAHVRDMRAKFKLGQDESAETLRRLLQALGDDPLAQWMRQFNRSRLEGDDGGA